MTSQVTYEEAGGADADPEAFTRRILLQQLERSPKTRAQLQEVLRGKAVPDEIAARVLDRFEEVNLIDDAAFAQEWVRSRHVNRSLAPRLLRQELARKGVSPEHIEMAMDQVNAESLDGAARELVRKKLRAMGAVDRKKATQRLVGMLARKGYDPEQAFRIVNHELDSAWDPESE